MIRLEERSYRDRSFRVWRSAGSWFWFYAEGGAIGAATGEAEAVAEGRKAIDEFLPTTRTATFSDDRESREPAAGDERWWVDVLDALAEFLAMVRGGTKSSGGAHV